MSRYKAFYALCGALLTLWVMTASAHAGVRSSDPAAYVAFAAGQWPGSPCAGRERLIVTDLFARADVLGQADGPSCTVWVRRGLDPVTTCSTVVHEFGHLAGRQHDDSYPNVMNTTIYPTPVCIAYTAPSPRQQAEEFGRLMTGRTLSCRPAPHGRWSCRGRGGRYRVSMRNGDSSVVQLRSEGFGGGGR